MLDRLRKLLSPGSTGRGLTVPISQQRLEVLFEGMTYPVLVRRDARALRYTLRVKPSSREAVLTMPARGSLSTAKDFALRHGGWLAARFAKLPPLVDFGHGAVIPLRGESHRIESRPGARGTVWTEQPCEGDPVVVVAGDQAFVARRLREFLKREARKDLDEACTRHAAKLGVTIKRITLRDTKSRWGSCAADGSLSFSWRLIFAPAHVLDYLAAHEVAHRAEMNHSARYWRTVAAIYPDYERAEQWLKRNGASLHRWG
jgi:predicted metal-dependent hydrolase